MYHVLAENKRGNSSKYALQNFVNIDSLYRRSVIFSSLPDKGQTSKIARNIGVCSDKKSMEVQGCEFRVGSTLFILYIVFTGPGPGLRLLRVISPTPPPMALKKNENYREARYAEQKNDMGGNENKIPG